MWTRQGLVTLGGLLLGALAAGCVDYRSDYKISEGPANGALNVRYTIAGSSQAASCADVGASTVDLSIFYGQGRKVQRSTGPGGSFGFVSVPCDNFVASITLPPGFYSARAILSDEKGRPVAPAVELADVAIERGTTEDRTIDFEAPEAP